MHRKRRWSILRPSTGCDLNFLALQVPQAHQIPMRLFLLTALTMTAFAANSVLNRMAVGHYGMPLESFAIVRALSGAIVL
jgi:hypothetical protein